MKNVKANSFLVKVSIAPYIGKAVRYTMIGSNDMTEWMREAVKNR